MGTKPGRNDPCPCGSGKKYKHCCGGGEPRLDEESVRAFSDELGLRRYQDFLDSKDGGDTDAPSYMEFLGKPNAATAISHRLHEAMQGRQFRDAKELESFFEQFRSQENLKPKEAFLGLNSEQLYRILHADGLSQLSDVVALSKGSLPRQAGASRLCAIVVFLLARYRQSAKGLGLTATGNYKTALVAEVRDKFYADDFFRRENRTEDRFRELRVAHDFLVGHEYVRENGTMSILTAAGAQLAEASDPAPVWRELFDFLLYGYDWLAFLREEFQHQGLIFIQDSALFSLWLLKHAARSYVSKEDVYDSFVRAFPSFDPAWNRADDEAIELKLICMDYGIMFIDQFCSSLGLIEYEPADRADPFTMFNRKFRTTELFDEALVWNQREPR
jgi:hypothetical protein